MKGGDNMTIAKRRRKNSLALLCVFIIPPKIRLFYEGYILFFKKTFFYILTYKMI